MIYAAIAAGGTGSRMGADIPKQFMKVGGRRIIVRTAERFLKNGAVDLVYIGANTEWLGELNEMCRGENLDMNRIRIVGGGTDRNGTIFKIADAIASERGITEEDIIVTHDGARPFVPQRIISESIAQMKRFDAVTAAIPTTDTVLISADGKKVDLVPKRATVYRMQTPQTFRLTKLLSVYGSLSESQKLMLTDTASVFTSAGLPVGLIRGEETNIKITVPFDLDTAELIADKYDKSELL